MQKAEDKPKTRAVPKRAAAAKKPCPEEDEDGDEPDTRRRSTGPKITTGGRERPLRTNEVYIDADRKAAMIEAGVWDDEKLRARYLKRYQQYDKEHGRSRH